MRGKRRAVPGVGNDITSIVVAEVCDAQAVLPRPSIRDGICSDTKTTVWISNRELRASKQSATESGASISSEQRAASSARVVGTTITITIQTATATIKARAKPNYKILGVS